MLVPFPEADFESDPLWAATLTWQEEGQQFKGIIIAVLCDIAAWGRVYAVEPYNGVSNPDEWDYFPSTEIATLIKGGRATLSMRR